MQKELSHNNEKNKLVGTHLWLQQMQFQISSKEAR